MLLTLLFLLLTLPMRVPFSYITKFSLGWKQNKNVFLLNKWGWKTTHKGKTIFVMHVCNKIVFSLYVVFFILIYATVSLHIWKFTKQNRVSVVFFPPPYMQQKHDFIVDPYNYKIKSCFHCLLFRLHFTNWNHDYVIVRVATHNRILTPLFEFWHTMELWFCCVLKSR